MTDGPQQSNEPQGSDEEFRPKPGQPTVPFRGVTPPPAGEQQPPSGYGYPQQQSGYGYPQQQPPQQSGYGYPQQQQPQPQPDSGEPHAPAWAPPAAHIGEGGLPRQSSGGGEPDWSALADRAEEGNRRRKLFLIGGGVLAAVVVAAIVATAVVVNGHHKHTVAQPTTSPTDTPQQPSPSFSDITPPPPPDPRVVLSSSKTDTAPLTTQGLFPRHQLNYSGRKYVKATTSTSTSCSAVTGGGLGGVLARYGCHRMLRATYYRDGIAVTVGVAVFDTKADADHAKADAEPYVLPLSGGGVGSFCHATSCQTSANSVGRYAYFTIGGKIGGAPVSADEPQTLRSAEDVASFVFASIIKRGQDEAATATPAS